jgi:hypothetical protein
MIGEIYRLADFPGQPMVGTGGASTTQPDPEPQALETPEHKAHEELKARIDLIAVDY